MLLLLLSSTAPAVAVDCADLSGILEVNVHPGAAALSLKRCAGLEGSLQRW